MGGLSPREVLAQAAAASIDIQQDAARYDTSVTLAYHCAGWGFLVPHGVRAEVLPLGKIGLVPRAPRHCLGLSNVRGSVVPIFSLDLLLGQEPERNSRNQYFLLHDSPTGAVGVLVNEIPRSVQLSAQDQVHSVSHLPEQLEPHVRNVYRYREEIWHELDVESLLKI